MNLIYQTLINLSTAVDGVSKPAKKIEEITSTEVETNTITTNEPKVWNLTTNGPVLQSRFSSRFQ